MKNEKRLLNRHDVTLFRLIDDGYYPTIQIIKSFDEKKKMVTFSMWDDFSFEAISRETQNINEANKFEIEIDVQDPLYLHFNKLLGSDEQIIIDDDHSLEYNIKTMKISRSNKNIAIVFENNEKNPEIMSKFNVFIKNIMKDNRSKLFTRDDIKERLIQFFNGVREEFLEKEHKDKQIESDDVSR